MVEEVQKGKGCRLLSLSDENRDLYPPQSKVMAATREHDNLSDTREQGDACLMRYGSADNDKQPLWIKAIKPEGTFGPTLYGSRDLV